MTNTYRAQSTELLITQAVAIKERVAELNNTYQVYLLMDKEFHELKAIKEEIKMYELTYAALIKAAESKVISSIK
jgi:hypothetical protein